MQKWALLWAQYRRRDSGKLIKVFQCYVQIEKDTMDSRLLSTYNSFFIIQLHCHTLSSLHFQFKYRHLSLFHCGIQGIHVFSLLSAFRFFIEIIVSWSFYRCVDCG